MKWHIVCMKLRDTKFHSIPKYLFFYTFSISAVYNMYTVNKILYYSLNRGTGV